MWGCRPAKIKIGPHRVAYKVVVSFAGAMTA
jgi:hypothetical protein